MLSQHPLLWILTSAILSKNTQLINKHQLTKVFNKDHCLDQGDSP